MTAAKLNADRIILRNKSGNLTISNIVRVADAIDQWRDDIDSGKPPTFYRIGEGELARIEIGQGLATLRGGHPGRKNCVRDANRDCCLAIFAKLAGAGGKCRDAAVG